MKGNKTGFRKLKKRMMSALLAAAAGIWFCGCSLSAPERSGFLSSFQAKSETQDAKNRIARSYDTNVFVLQLSAEEKSALIKMADDLQNFVQEVAVDPPLSEDSFTKVYQILYWQIPLMFQLDRSSDTSYTKIDGKVTSFTPVYSMTKTRYQQTLAELEKTAAFIQAECQDKDDFETELYIHDYLADLITYDDTSANAHTLYGALLENRAVCEGYTLAFQYLLEKCGLDVFTIIGEASQNSDGQSSGHSWTAVSMEDGWYYCDLTWDDQDSGDYQIASHTYFNLTYDQIIENRNDDLSVMFGTYPKENHTAYSYFEMNSLVIDTVDEYMAMLEQIMIAKEDALLEVRFSSAEVYFDVCSRIDAFISQAAEKYGCAPLISWKDCGYIRKDSFLQLEEFISFSLIRDSE